MVDSSIHFKWSIRLYLSNRFGEQLFPTWGMARTVVVHSSLLLVFDERRSTIDEVRWSERVSLSVASSITVFEELI
jgi:hypothetical protein